MESMFVIKFVLKAITPVTVSSDDWRPLLIFCVITTPLLWQFDSGSEATIWVGDFRVLTRGQCVGHCNRIPEVVAHKDRDWPTVSLCQKVVGAIEPARIEDHTTDYNRKQLVVLRVTGSDVQ